MAFNKWKQGVTVQEKNRRLPKQYRRDLWSVPSSSTYVPEIKIGRQSIGSEMGILFNIFVSPFATPKKGKKNTFANRDQCVSPRRGFSHLWPRHRLAGNKNPFWGLELGAAAAAANWNWNWEPADLQLGFGSESGLGTLCAECVLISLAPLSLCMFSALFFVISHFDGEFSVASKSV